MPDFLGDEMRKVKKDEPEKEEKEIKCKWTLMIYIYRSAVFDVLIINLGLLYFILLKLGQTFVLSNCVGKILPFFGFFVRPIRFKVVWCVNSLCTSFMYKLFILNKIQIPINNWQYYRFWLTKFMQWKWKNNRNFLSTKLITAGKAILK